MNQVVDRLMAHPGDWFDVTDEIESYGDPNSPKHYTNFYRSVGIRFAEMRRSDNRWYARMIDGPE